MSLFSLLKSIKVKCYPGNDSVFYSVDDICRVCNIAKAKFLIRGVDIRSPDRKDVGLDDSYIEGSQLVIVLESINRSTRTSKEDDLFLAIIHMISRDRELIELNTTEIAEQIKTMQQEILSMLTKTNTALLFDRHKVLCVQSREKLEK